MPLVPLPGLQRADHRPEQEDEHRHPEQDEQPERDRGGEEDHRDDDVRDDRAREPRRDVVRAAGPHRVVRDGGDDLARREPAADRRAGAGGVVRDELREAEGRLEPVEDGVPVPHDAGDGLRVPRPRRTSTQAASVELSSATIPSIAWPIANGMNACATIQRTPNTTPGDERRHLVPADPEQQPNGRARVRDAGIGDGELDHAAARVVVGMRRSGTASRVPILATCTRRGRPRAARG